MAFILFLHSSVSQAEEKPALPVAAAVAKKSFTGPDSILLETSAVVDSIAIASRANPMRSQELWNVIAAEKPSLFVSTGDLIEPNFGTPSDIEENFRILRLQPDFAKFRTRVPILANWGNGESAEIAEDKSVREVAKLEYIKFFNNDSQFVSPRQSGIYHGVVLGNAHQRLHLIFLDTHFFKISVGENSQLLGAEQWKWLATEIQKPADLTAFVFSESFLSEAKEYSVWNQFPQEKQRLIKLLEAYGKITHQNNILLFVNSGFGEIRKRSLTKKLTVLEISAGGINRRALNNSEKTKLRQGAAVSDLNYGLIEINWKKKKISLKINGASGKKLNEKSFTL